MTSQADDDLANGILTNEVITGKWSHILSDSSYFGNVGDSDSLTHIPNQLIVPTITNVT